MENSLLAMEQRSKKAAIWLNFFPLAQFLLRTGYEIWKYLWHGKNIHEELIKLREENQKLKQELEKRIEE